MKRRPARTFEARAHRVVRLTTEEVSTPELLRNPDYNLRIGKYVFPAGHVATQCNDLHELLIREFRAVRRRALLSAARSVDGTARAAWTRRRIVAWLRERANRAIR